MTNKLWCGLAAPQVLNESEFIETYKEAFGGPPYFEEYSDDEVREEIITPHMEDGMVVYATDSDKLIGFGCAVPFKSSPEDVQEFLEYLHRNKDLPDAFDHRNAWYMSELGVRNSYRGKGVAWELVRQRMVQAIAQGSHQYFMRTARVGSNSMPMYAKSGAIPLDQFQDVSSIEQATENHTQSLQRVYLWGDCAEAVARIETIQREKGYPLFRDA